MGKKTGNPRGRPAGSKNKASVARQQAIAASGLTPLDYMLGVLRNPRAAAARRAWAAAAAAPYVHPKLASIEHSGPNGGAITHEVTAIERRIVDPK